MENTSVVNPVFKNIKDFLADSEKNTLMEKCYSAIRENHERKFDSSLKRLDNEKFDAHFPLVSAVVLTANKFECDALNYLVSIQNGGEVYKRQDKIHIFEDIDMYSPVAYILKISSSYILHLLANETGSYTPGGSSDLVRYVSENKLLRPSCIMSFGICYGRDPGTQKIGDVIIPRKLYPWSIGQKFYEGRFEIKHDNFNLSLEDKFPKNNIYSTIAEYCDDDNGRTIEKNVDIKGEKFNFKISVYCGNISTGEAVVSSEEYKEKIRLATHNEKEMGGEMEGYGLAKECIYYAKIPCIIAKGICDWGELKDIEKVFSENHENYPEDLKDKLQAYAAFCSGISLLDLFLEEGDKFLSLNIINGLKKKGICSEYHYAIKEKIIKGIKEFLALDCEYNYDDIFDGLVKLKKLVEVKKSYNKISVYHTERKENA